MSDPSEIVAGGYDAAASRYAQLERNDDPWPRMRWLEHVLDRLTDGSRVLDLGCASGVPVAARVSQNHQVTGVDVSTAHIDRARQYVPEGNFLCEDILQVDFPAGHFDVVVSFYTIDHIPREQHLALLQRIHHWLRTGGLLLLSVEDSDQPGAVADWLDVPMFFSHYDASTTERLTTEAGFTVERSEIEVQTEGGDEIPYLFLLGRKESMAAPPPEPQFTDRSRSKGNRSRSTPVGDGAQLNGTHVGARHHRRRSRLRHSG